MARRIVIAAVGSPGDLHPFVAIALALKARGAEPVLAVPDAQVAKIKGAGLEAHALLSYESMRAKLGISIAEAAHRTVADWDFMFRHVLLHALEDSVAVLDRLSERADLIVGSIFTIAAEIVAQKRGVPHAVALLQPTAFQGARDPPIGLQTFMMAPYPATGLALQYNRSRHALNGWELKRRYAGLINKVRAQHGLPRLCHAPFVQTENTPALRMALYSPVLGPDDPDATHGAQFCGFPVFDSETGARAPLDHEVEAFLTNGPPPLIFSLGTVASLAPGAFYKASREVCSALGRRGILLTGDADQALADKDILVRAYLPHSKVFSRCAAIVQHGGIGSTGQALASGKPQLVVPHMGDQWDNGERVRRLGVAQVLPSKLYNAKRAAVALDHLLNDAGAKASAMSVRDVLASEGGARTAADLLLSAI